MLRDFIRFLHSLSLSFSPSLTLTPTLITALSAQMRDLRQVADKLKVVLLPLGQASQDSVLLKLRECKY